MRHLKRQKAPKNWPIERKGKKFVVSGNEKGIPILIAIRDVLKIAKNRKEVKRAIAKKAILLSNKAVKKDREIAFLLDTITIVPSKKTYRVILSESGKFNLEEAKKSDETKKVSKVIGKKILKGKKTQANLWDGRNFIYNKKFNVNDSVVIDLKKNSIETVLPLKKDAKALVIGGKHTGKEGKIKNINDSLKSVELDTKKGTYNVLIKQIMIIE
ncbi:hypothetical protein B6U91_01365 [Candidatus Pacearchaeota archaeon ex4484_71]|nr:MAG: hypothetical protein B6U91_01365 [Candidatus Pacearchaeota archaeon ex4484_71]